MLRCSSFRRHEAKVGEITSYLHVQTAAFQGHAFSVLLFMPWVSCKNINCLSSPMLNILCLLKVYKLSLFSVQVNNISKLDAMTGFSAFPKTVVNSCIV